MKKTNRYLISSGSEWEKKIGYSRGIQIGNTIEFSGTTAVDEQGNTVGKGSAYEQTKYIIQKIETILKQRNLSLDHVVRTRIYTTDISKWSEIGKAHGTFFSSIRPVTTMIGVSELIDKDLLVEIEFSVIV